MADYKAARALVRQRPGRMTQADVLLAAESMEPVVNLVRHLPELGRALDDRTSSVHGYGKEPYFLWGPQAVTGLGAPMVRVSGLETMMGVWALDDLPSGIAFFVWSDGYKAKPWKGTSIEVRATKEQWPQVTSAFERLSDHLLERYLAQSLKEAASKTEAPSKPVVRSKARSP